MMPIRYLLAEDSEGPTGGVFLAAVVQCVCWWVLLVAACAIVSRQYKPNSTFRVLLTVLIAVRAFTATGVAVVFNSSRETASSAMVVIARATINLGYFSLSMELAILLLAGFGYQITRKALTGRLTLAVVVFPLATFLLSMVALMLAVSRHENIMAPSSMYLVTVLLLCGIVLLIAFIVILCSLRNQSMSVKKKMRELCGIEDDNLGSELSPAAQNALKAAVNGIGLTAGMFFGGSAIFYYAMAILLVAMFAADEIVAHQSLYWAPGRVLSSEDSELAAHYNEQETLLHRLVLGVSCYYLVFLVSSLLVAVNAASAGLLDTISFLNMLVFTVFLFAVLRPQSLTMPSSQYMALMAHEEAPFLTAQQPAPAAWRPERGVSEVAAQRSEPLLSGAAGNAV